jgi:protein-S-isoprenylcysteine O-methyltransferase Ste14
MSRSARRLTFNQRGGWWIVGQLILHFLILVVPGPAFPSGTFPPILFHWIGGTLITVASLILLSGAKSLSKALTPYPYPIEEAPLIRKGIYCFIRHPLYLGVILGGFGVAVWRMNILSGGFTLFLTFFLNAKANREEAWLLEKFPEYKDYRKKSKKLLPFIY